MSMCSTLVVLAFSGGAALAFAAGEAAIMANDQVQVLASNGPAWQLHYSVQAIETRTRRGASAIRMSRHGRSCKPCHWTRRRGTPSVAVVGEPPDVVTAMARAWTYQASVEERSTSNCTCSLGNYFPVHCPPSARCASKAAARHTHAA